MYNHIRNKDIYKSFGNSSNYKNYQKEKNDQRTLFEF